MTVEPMTDAPIVDPPMTDSEWADVRAYVERCGYLLVHPEDNDDWNAFACRIAYRLIATEAERDAERSRADAAEAARSEQHDIVARIWKHLGSPSYEELAGRSIYDLIGCLKAERDAAVARAMPEPVLVRTMEEVGALTTGAYRIAAPWQPRRWILGWRHPPRTWTLLIDTGASGVKDDHIVGSWVQRLPDLPTPTAGETP